MSFVAIRCVRRLPFRDPPMVVTSSISSEGIHIELALEGEYDSEGETPPFVDRFPSDCEYSAQHPSPQTLDRVSHRNSLKISLNGYFRMRRSLWTGTQSTYHGPTRDSNYP